MEDTTIMTMENTRNSTIERLWNLTKIYNTLNKQDWGQNINAALNEHQNKLVQLIQVEGYDGRTIEEKWNFPTSLMFTLRYVRPPSLRSNSSQLLAF